ncbi:MAG: nucleoside hydrolase [Ruminococcaceae bacterium]|nr:nucleoside hydrolase [Oscillospiraceae bacterium]
MTNEQRIRNLNVPCGKIDVVIDTDTYNEIDDQYALAYLLKSDDKLDTKAIYAAPFFNTKSTSAADGMEKSYNEIIKITSMLGIQKPLFKGATSFLADEKTPVISDAARDLAERAELYSAENPLYVVAIGAITNVASAILMNPKVAENTVVVWLGGHAMHFGDSWEFNMYQDVAAARVVFGCGVPLVQLPCMGVVSEFTLSEPELECWFRGKNELADYLADITIKEMLEISDGERVCSKVVWDVTAVAWLLNDNDRFMSSRIITAPIPSYDFKYTQNPDGHLMRYVYHIKKDNLLRDLVAKLTSAL